MKLEIAKLIVQLADDSELEVRESYSGRGMFGREVAAVTANSIGHFVECLGAVMEEAINSPEDVANIGEHLYGEGIRTDSMGHGVIIY